MRRPIATLAIALTALPGMAQAAEPPCLTAAEFTDLASYGLPSVITGATQRCAAALPAGAWLLRNGGQLSARYAASKAAAWPGAKAAFLKMSSAGGQEASGLIKGLPDTTLQAMLDGVIEGMVGQRLPTARCATVDRVVRLLAPLPPENTAELIALAAGLGSKASGAGAGDIKAGGFRLCPA
ncbi:MAG TPA: hypothetical protein VF440_13400 [Novosphingobium sp.]